MSRHNRRRTRGPKSSPLHSDHQHQYHSHSHFQPTNTSPFPSSTTPNPHPHLPLPPPRHRRTTDISARHWHNRYLAWQTRDIRQREEKAKLESEQRRIFGGDGLDAADEGAEGLCGRMMDFFRGLEFLEG